MDRARLAIFPEFSLAALTASASAERAAGAQQISRRAGLLYATSATLSPAGADELAARWAAFATRRGPIAYEQSAAKLGHVLAARAGVAVGDQHVAVGDEVARTLDLAWTLEGGDLEEVVDRYAAHAVGGLLPTDTDAILDATVAKLRDLAAQATVAADAIEVSR